MARLDIDIGADFTEDPYNLDSALQLEVQEATYPIKGKSLKN